MRSSKRLRSSTRLYSQLSLTVLLIACLMSLGCRKSAENLSTEYGKINGVEGGTSINGTSVLADMFSNRGFRVKRRSKISPRIEHCQTLVWFPDSHSCPNSEVTQAINNWLDGGYQRTFIYVGRDYNARADYFNDVLKNAPAAQKEELMRRLAESELERDTVEDLEFWWVDDLRSCQWFDRVEGSRSKAKKLSGPMTDFNLSPPWSQEDLMQSNYFKQSAEIEVSEMLSPTTASDWESTPLLLADGKEFAFQLKRTWGGPPEGKIVVVSNGSFLVNYALVDSEHRKLAGSLIDLCDPAGDVMFLESGPGGIKVSDSDTSNHNRWSWIAQAPLCYIVPHFLMWGILFCFVFFPIFGRPRVIKRKSTSSFRSHVNAFGKMMGRTKLPDQAINQIRKYQQLVSGDSKRKKD